MGHIKVAVEVKKKFSKRIGLCQKLPQARLLLWIRTSLEFCRWIPSVLGLSPGDEMLISCTVTPMQLSNLSWFDTWHLVDQSISYLHHNIGKTWSDVDNIKGNSCLGAN